MSSAHSSCQPSSTCIGAHDAAVTGALPGGRVKVSYESDKNGHSTPTCASQQAMESGQCGGTVATDPTANSKSNMVSAYTGLAAHDLGAVELPLSATDTVLMFRPRRAAATSASRTSMPGTSGLD